MIDDRMEEMYVEMKSWAENLNGRFRCLGAANRQKTIDDDDANE